MSFLGGIEDFIAAGKECTGPAEFRDTEQRIRARTKTLEGRLREAVELVADMECQCKFPGDECQRCEVVGVLQREPTYDGRVA
jgi:hypothetical protein